MNNLPWAKFPSTILPQYSKEEIINAIKSGESRMKIIHKYWDARSGARFSQILSREYIYLEKEAGIRE